MSNVANLYHQEILFGLFGACQCFGATKTELGNSVKAATEYIANGCFNKKDNLYYKEIILDGRSYYCVGATKTELVNDIKNAKKYHKKYFAI